jgi:uncharacterized integral membrane protein
MNKRSLTRDILISVVIGVLGFMFMIQNREVVEIDFIIVDISAGIGVWIVAALTLGLLLGFTNRSPTLRGRGKRLLPV